MIYVWLLVGHINIFCQTLCRIYKIKHSTRFDTNDLMTYENVVTLEVWQEFI